VYLLDVVLYAALQVSIDLAEAVVDFMESAGDGRGLIAEHRSGRVALRLGRYRLECIEETCDLASDPVRAELIISALDILERVPERAVLALVAARRLQPRLHKLIARPGHR